MIKDRLLNRFAHRRVFYLMLVLFFTACTTMTVWTQAGAQANNIQSERLVFTAIIQNRGAGVVGVQNTPVTIYLNEFSTLDEVKELVEMLRTRGPDPVVSKLESMDRGQFSPVGRVGTSIAMMRSINTDKGRIIRALASRPETFREMFGMPGRSKDYPFGFMELRIGKDGKGEGALILAAKINFDKQGMLQMESFDQGQVKLVNVRQQE